MTRAAALQGQDGGSTRTVGYVGKKGKDFEFSHVLPVTVEFAECSAKGQADGEADVTAVEKWLEKMAWERQTNRKRNDYSKKYKLQVAKKVLSDLYVEG